MLAFVPLTFSDALTFIDSHAFLEVYGHLSASVRRQSGQHVSPTPAAQCFHHQTKTTRPLRILEEMPLGS